MTSRAVYAVSEPADQELFLGYTTLTSSDPAQLLDDVLARMSTDRMSRYAELQVHPSIQIVAREIPAGDRWMHRAEHNQHKRLGKPYIRDLSVRGLVVVDPETGEDMIMEANESDGSVKVVNENGVEMRLLRNAVTGKLDLVEKDGTARTLALVKDLPQQVTPL